MTGAKPDHRKRPEGNMMNGKSAKGFDFFHKMMIYFALWVYAGMLAFTAIRNIVYAKMNDPTSEFIIELLIQLILLGSAILLIKARFDLKNGDIGGARKILIAGLMATLVFIIELMTVDVLGGFVEINFFYPLLAMALSISTYRYYMMNMEKLAMRGQKCEA